MGLPAEWEAKPKPGHDEASHDGRDAAQRLAKQHICDQERDRGDGQTEEGRAYQQLTIGGAQHPLLVAVAEADPVIRRRGNEEDRGRRGRDESREVKAPLKGRYLGEPRLKGNDQQERKEHLTAGQDDPKFIQELDEFAIKPLLLGLGQPVTSELMGCVSRRCTLDWHHATSVAFALRTTDKPRCFDVLADIEGPGGLWWLTLLSPGLVLAILGALLIIVLVAIVLGLLVYRRARRDGRWGPLVLALQLESAPPGPRREVLKLRMQLQRALARARRAVAASVSEGSRSEIDDLCERALRTGAIIDRQLRILQTETDVSAVRDGLRDARLRVDELDAVANRISEAARTTLASSMDGSLDELRGDADRELEALRAGVDALDRLDSGAGPDLQRIPARREIPARRR